MGQIFLPENIPGVVVASTTSLTLASTNNGQPTRINIGGQQYALSSTLTLTTSGTGANGLDTGALGAIQLWYVYAILNQSSFAAALVASQIAPSTGPLMPSGYGTAFKLVGAFYTTGGSLVGSTVTITGVATSSPFSLGITQRGSSNGVAFTNTTITRGQGTRVGDKLLVSILTTFTGTPAGGTGAYQLVIPNLNMDLTKAENTISPYLNNILYNTSTGANYTIAFSPGNAGGTINLTGLNVNAQAGATTSFQPGGSSPVALSGTYTFTLEALIPISGWNTTLL